MHGASTRNAPPSQRAPDPDIDAGHSVCLETYAAIRSMGPTVLIVDDHVAFRASARALLQAEGFNVIGEATDGAQAVAAVAALRPQIVLLNIQLPDLDGLAVAEQPAAAPTPGCGAHLQP